jgi:hypothetical protein
VVPFTVILFRWVRAETDADEPTPMASERLE